MKPFVAWYTRICLFSALVAVVVQNFAVTSLATLHLPRWLTQLAPFLAATATYFLLYKSLMSLYEWRGWKLVLKGYNISGIWYQEYLSPSDPTYVRHGVTFVDQGIWHLTFNGRNYDPGLKRESLTLWNSTAVALEDDARLVISYVAHRCDQPNKRDPILEKTGILLITVIRDEKGRPSRMTGIFEDTAPSNRRGSITWWRKTEWSGSLEAKGL